jgi:hypothetical protein
MTIEEILKGLAHKNRRFPRESVQQAIAKKDEITPHLLGILERAANQPDDIFKDDHNAYLYALFLLAQFREKRAYPLVIKLVSHPPDVVEDLLGDTITEDLKSILASVSCGDISLITELIENTDAGEFVRAAALESLLALVAIGERSRDEVMGYYKSLFEGRLEREQSFAWGELIICATDLYPEEVYEDIKKAFDDGLIDKMIIGLGSVDKALALGKDAVLAKFPKSYRLIENTIKEMESWVSYQEPKEKPNPRLENILPFEPYTRTAVKVGRNDPCPCGSGKKYKKCCGSNV